MSVVWQNASPRDQVTYATEGQFFNWVPSKTSQSLLVTEKSISGAPPGPLTIMLKAIGITYVISSAHQFQRVAYRSLSYINVII